jgi:hypothetical protein
LPTEAQKSVESEQLLRLLPAAVRQVEHEDFTARRTCEFSKSFS